MTSLFTARRRAEEFAALVDGSDPQASGAPSAELAQLAGVVSALRVYRTVDPRPEFAADLRARLIAEAETVLTPAAAGLQLPVRPRGPRERKLVAAASAVVLLGGTATMAAAAQSALPGEALYPIKRGIERAEAELNVSPAGKGHDLLTQASGRLAEVEGLLGSTSPASAPAVPATLEDFTIQADEGARLLFESFEETRDPAKVLAVREFAAEGIAMLESLAESLPPEARDELTAAALLLMELDERATALCGTCDAGLPDLEVPGIFLAAAEVDRVLTTVAATDLNNDHPVVVPRATTENAADKRDGEKRTKRSRQQPVSADTGKRPQSTDDPTSRPVIQSPEDSPGPSLPDLEGALTEERKVDAAEEGSKLVGSITDGLSGTVETILPDPQPDTDLVD